MARIEFSDDARVDATDSATLAHLEDGKAAVRRAGKPEASNKSSDKRRVIDATDGAKAPLINDSGPGNASASAAMAETKAARVADDIINELAKGRALRNNEQIVQWLRELSLDESRMVPGTFKAKSHGADIGQALQAKLSPAQFERAQAYLSKFDPPGFDSHLLQSKLLALKDAGSDRAGVELDVAAFLSTRNQSQIDAASARLTIAPSLDQALKSQNVSVNGQLAIDVARKGKDRRQPADVLALSDVAIKAHDEALFDFAMSISDSRAREALSKNNGDARLQQAFKGSQLKRVLEYAHTGGLALESQIRTNTGLVKDNDDAIEHALLNASTEERTMFQQGWALSQRSDRSATLSPQQGQSLNYYSSIHNALGAAAGKPLSTVGYAKQMAKWEDMLLTNSSEGLVSTLSGALGVYWLDADKKLVVGAIENMDQTTWHYFHDHPEQQQRVKQLMTSFCADTRRAAEQMFAAKMAAGTFEQAQDCNRCLLDCIKSNPVNLDELTKEMSHLSPAETHRLTSDPQYRQAIEQQFNGLREHERKAALGMLDRVSTGLTAVGLMETAHKMATTAWSDGNGGNRPPTEVFRQIEEAIQQDPDTFKKIQHDPQLKKEFVNAVSDTLPWPTQDFQEARGFLDALVSSKDGRLPMAQKLLFDLSYVDHYGLLEDLQRASPRDIAEFAGLKSKLLEKIEPEERSLIDSVMSNGKVLPEDWLRAYVVFRNRDFREAHLGEITTKRALAVLHGQCETEAGKQDLQKRYFQKYGSLLSFDLRTAMNPKTFAEANKDLTSTGQRPNEDFETAQQSYASRRRGLGGRLIDGYVDGTGFQSDGAYNKILHAMAITDGPEQWNKLPEATKAAYLQQLSTALDDLANSRGMVSDAAVNFITVAAAVAGSVESGGVSLGLLSRVTVFGALLNAYASDHVLNNGNTSFSEYCIRAVSGGVNGLVGTIGPTEIAALLRLGEKTAGTAAGIAARELAKNTVILSTEGANIITGRGQLELSHQMADIVRDAIVSGRTQVDRKAVAELAEKFANTANQQNKVKVEAIFNQSLTDAIRDESASSLRPAARAYGLTAAAGTAASGAGNATSGVLRGDPVTDNLRNTIVQSIATGAFAGAFHGMLDHLGRPEIPLPSRAQPKLAAGDIAGIGSSIAVVPVQGPQVPIIPQ